jgi:hypothetical protein
MVDSDQEAMGRPVRYDFGSARRCGRFLTGMKVMKRMFTGFSILSAFALLCLSVGCVSPQQTENLLSAAGFKTATLTSAQQQLRPYRVTASEQNGQTYYVYADPARNQIYVGDPSQYQRYRQLKKELEIAQQSYNPPVYGP